MPRKPNTRPDEPGHERVLEAGLELFGEQGYDATSIADIGKRAGISKSVLYHYFDSKAKLYEAIIKAQTQELLDRVRSAVPPDPDAPRLRAGVEAYLEFLQQHPATWRLFLRDPPAEPGLTKLYERLARERAAGLIGLLAAPRKQQKVPWHVDLVATGIRAFATWWYDNPQVPRDAVAQAILDFAAAGNQSIAHAQLRDAPELAGPE